jgi:NAD-dependent SIR2 family protein deacetylase
MSDGIFNPAIEIHGAARTIRDSLVDGDCVIFLGAGAAKDKSKEDFPDANELSAELAKQCGLEWIEYVPLATTAFFYESVYSRTGLHKFLRDKIDRQDILPSETVEAVAELALILQKRGKAVFIVTTNYDQTFERAYRKLADGVDPNVIKYRGAISPHDKAAELYDGLKGKSPQYWRARPGQTYLYKMHGCISEAEGNKPMVVITEEDYVNFLANALHEISTRRVLYELTSRMAGSTTLFIGYSLSDWNFRVIFKATAEGTGDQPSYAIQYKSKAAGAVEFERQRWNAAVRFWDRKSLTVINCEAHQFVRYLIEQVNAPVAV